MKIWDKIALCLHDLAIFKPKYTRPMIKVHKIVVPKKIKPVTIIAIKINKNGLK